MSASRHEVGPWIERLARLGYAAKGLVYLVIGGLAAEAALTARGRTTDTEGALRTILDQPYGRLALWAAAIGLAGYALWRLVSAVADPEHGGHGLAALGRRGANFGKGAVHALFAVQSARLAGGRRAAGGPDPGDWTARVLAAPAGRWIVVAVGLAVVVYAIYQFYRAAVAKFEKRLDFRTADARVRAAAVRFGQFGIAARGVVFLVIGIFVLRAAVQRNANEVRGFADALRTLERQPAGPMLFGLVAFGLVAYGLFELVEARYRRIRVIAGEG